MIQESVVEEFFKHIEISTALDLFCVTAHNSFCCIGGLYFDFFFHEWLRVLGFSEDREQATVHIECDARDVARQIRAKPDDGLADFRRLPESPQWCSSAKSL